MSYELFGLFVTEMQSFINLGRKIESPVMTSYLKLVSNCMPIWYRFEDIGSFNNLLIKLIDLITMV